MILKPDAAYVTTSSQLSKIQHSTGESPSRAAGGREAPNTAVEYAAGGRERRRERPHAFNTATGRTRATGRASDKSCMARITCETSLNAPGACSAMSPEP